MNFNPIAESGPSGKNSGISFSKKTALTRPAVPVRSGDKVELVSSHDRDVVLNSIKAKVKQGFYKSDEVADDISEKLAHLFERF